MSFYLNPLIILIMLKLAEEITKSIQLYFEKRKQVAFFKSFYKPYFKAIPIKHKKRYTKN